MDKKSGNTGQKRVKEAFMHDKYGAKLVEILYISQPVMDISQKIKISAKL